MKTAVLWDVAPCRSCVNWRSSETSVHTRSTRRHIPAAATCLRRFLAREFFYPEHGNDTFLRNVGSHNIYTAPHPSCSHLFTLVPRSRIFLPWRWRRYASSKRQYTQDLHGATSKLQPPVHANSSLENFSTLNMEAILSSETLVHTRSTRRHIPKECILLTTTLVQVPLLDIASWVMEDRL
jgi:hypothetical protein